MIRSTEKLESSLVTVAVLVIFCLHLASCADETGTGDPSEHSDLREREDIALDIELDSPGPTQDLQPEEPDLETDLEPDLQIEDGTPDETDETVPCQLGDWYCEEGWLHTCDESGSWVETACNGDCSAGVCIPHCHYGERRCLDELTVEVCDDVGTWSVLEECEPELGQSCDNARVACLTICQALEPGMSNLGCIFWPLALANYGNEGYDHGSTAPDYRGGVRIFVANPNDEELTVSLSDAYQEFDLEEAANVPAQGWALLDLPQTPAGAVQDLHLVDGSSIAYAAFRLETSLPAFVIQFNPANIVLASSDASLLLPERALDTHYHVMTVPHSTKQVWDNLYHHPAGFSVVATRDSTEVRIRPTAPTQPLLIATHESRAQLEEHDLSPMLPGEERTFILNSYQVLSLVTDSSDYPCSEDKPLDPEHGRICVIADDFARGVGCYVYGRRFCQPGPDLTGTLVAANKAVAVFATARNAMVPYYMFGTEHLEAQLLPTRYWGRSYVADRLAARYRYYACSRGNYRRDHQSTCPFGSGMSFYRILAAEDDTTVTIRTPTASVVIEEAPKDFNYHNQLDWVTSPLDWETIAGQPCVDEDGVCEVQITLDAGEVLEFGDVFSHHISADRGIMVARLIPSEEYVGVPGMLSSDAYIELLWKKGGDPALTYLVPTDQLRSDYSIYVVGRLSYGYLGLVAPAGTQILLNEGSSSEVLLDTADGSWESVDQGWVTRFYEIHNLSNRDRPREIEHSTYSMVLEGGGFHNLRSVDGTPFGVQVYGFDHYISYAYPGGLALEVVNPEYVKE